MRKVTEVRGEAGTPSHSPALHPSSKSPLPRLSVQNTWPSADIPVSRHSSHMCPPATPGSRNPSCVSCLQAFLQAALPVWKSLLSPGCFFLILLSGVFSGITDSEIPPLISLPSAGSPSCCHVLPA